jgi:hypothetical protein
MSSITIPPAVLEAGAEVCRDYRRADVKSEVMARAIFLAMIKAWEGAKIIRDDGRRQTYVIPAIIIPLPQENENG